MADYNPGAAAEASAKGVTSATNIGMDQGTALASTYMDMQAKQQKNEEMKQQLDDMKWTTAKGLMNNYIAASDPVKKAMLPQVQKRFQTMGMDPMVLDALKDPDMQLNYKQVMDTFGNDPNAAANGLAMLTHANAFTTGVSGLAEHVQGMAKMKTAQALKEAEMANRERIAHGNNATTVEAAGIRASGMNARAQNSVSSNYERSIGKSEDALYQANRATDIIGKIQTGDLKSTKTLAADLDAAQASLLGGGKPSTVYGQQAVHMDDIYSRAQNAMQFITANPQDTQSPAKLDQLKKDVSALSDFYKEQHAQKYNAWRQTVPEGMRPAFDNRYKMFRKQQGIPAPIHEMDDETASPAQGGGVHMGQPSVKIKPNQLPPAQLHQKIQQAKQAGYSDEEIQQYLGDEGGQ